MSLEQSFGFPEEWEDFHSRHPLFIERFPNLVRAIEAGLLRTFRPSSLADQVVSHLSNVCREDFMEILLLAGNGYGIGAQKLLRGMYERAVTARYISMNTEKAEDFIDFGKVNLYKLIEPSRRAHGRAVLPPEKIAELQAFRKAYVRRRRTPKGLGGRLKHLLRRFTHLRKEERSTARWSDDLSFESMAIKVGSLGKMLLYGWHLPTLQNHATFQNISARVRELNGRKFAFDGGPSREAADDALNFATLVLLDVLELQRDHFRLPELGELIEQCNADYTEVWHPEEFRPRPQAEERESIEPASSPDREDR